MHKYRSLAAWQSAHDLALAVLRATDEAYHPRALAVFDQMRRAAVSVEANLVEGYALGTPAQFRRHLRIALGSAAEVEAMAELAAAREYLDRPTSARIAAVADRTIGLLIGLWRTPPAERRPWR